MSDSSWSRTRGLERPLVGCGALLLCATIFLLSVAVLRLVRHAPATPNIGTPVTADGATSEMPTPTPARPLDGKQLPPGTAAFPPVPEVIDQQVAPERAALDFAKLFTTTLPAQDFFATAEELGRRELGARTMPAATAQLGDRTTFQTDDGPREAELVYLDDLAAYWVESGLTLDRDTLAAAAERLRRHYYPLLVENFGSEWRPGIDGDTHITVLLVLGPPDAYELGYFTDEDEYPRSLFAESNQREMVYLNMSQLTPGDALFDGTLVHEVQHLIQWNLDSNEDTWLNEGLSQIAETLVGLDTVDVASYLEHPQTRVDRWAAAPDIHAHYAGGFLFLLYLWEQTGDSALRELARHPANGLAAVQAVLAGHRPDLTLEQLTGDWAAALYTDGETTDSRFGLRRVNTPDPSFANRARQLPFETTAGIEQFSVDYVDLDFSGPAVISFAGDTTALVIDPPPSGSLFWYAPPADSSRAQLTAALDLTGLSSAQLEFDVWQDLEPGFDFAYLSVSVDGGRVWERLSPQQATTGPHGPAWGGASATETGSGWAHETLALDAYAGREILLRFEVVTDFEVTGRGFAVADIRVPESGEQLEWEPSGFVETGGLLPQRWAVRVIRDGATPEVTALALDERNRSQIVVDLGPAGGALAVVPLNPFAESTADYWLRIEREPPATP